MPFKEAAKRLLHPFLDQLVYSSSAYVDLKSTLVSLSSSLISFSESPGGVADERLLEALRLLAPYDAPGLRLVRIGDEHDGGYVMAEDFEDVDGAISIGVGRDVSWDRGIANRGIPVALFDPTVRRPPQPVKGSRFFRIGLSPTPSKRYKSLSEIVALSSFSSMDLILKVDIEGDEWVNLDALEPDDLMPFRQVALELHGLDGLRSAERGSRILTNLSRVFETHAPIHIHGNNYDPLIRFDNYWFPRTIEVTYLRRDPKWNFARAMRLAKELNYPCDPRVPDFTLEALPGLVHQGEDKAANS